MSIKIALSSISSQDIEDILFHYNTLKPANSGVLENLVCNEGGFRIVPPPCNTVVNKSDPYGTANKRARELRWNSGKYLVTYFNRPGFTEEEKVLLFKVMRLVLGKENVSYYKTYGDAKKDSPSIKDNFMVRNGTVDLNTTTHSGSTSNRLLRFLPI
jgi:hypothetical protein